MIDRNRLIEMREDVGADSFLTIADLFLSEVQERLDGVEAMGAEALDNDTLHFLRGSALNIGFSDFAQLCEQGELGKRQVTHKEAVEVFRTSWETFDDWVGTRER